MDCRGAKTVKSCLYLALWSILRSSSWHFYVLWSDKTILTTSASPTSLSLTDKVAYSAPLGTCCFMQVMEILQPGAWLVIFVRVVHLNQIMVTLSTVDICSKRVLVWLYFIIEAGQKINPSPGLRSPGQGVMRERNCDICLQIKSPF